MSKDKETKVRRRLSYRTKWIITLLLMVVAVGLLVICFSQGLLDFKPGSVKPNDDPEVVETDSADDGEGDEPKLSEYNVLISEGNGGTALPSGRVSVDAWGSITVSFTPQEGYEIKAVVVDGDDKGPLTSYTLSYITADHTIMVTFEKLPEPTPEPTPTPEPDPTPEIPED
ncbi:MAG: hypothetical protein HUJ66_06635 [Oscillospiraceae bacterium]|mgnify:CR=1 FL=1|nr:hypothetical protein [Oscillospiraceae bacterium]